jgi:hypothetical protein
MRSSLAICVIERPNSRRPSTSRSRGERAEASTGTAATYAGLAMSTMTATSEALALVCAIALPLAMLVFVDPPSSIGLWARCGYVLPASTAADPAAMEYVHGIGHWASTGSVGVDLFGLLIAVTAFRRGDRWAWLAFWYWPVMIATHFATCQSSFRYAPLLWLGLAVAALLATRKRAWGARPAHTGAPRPLPAPY